MNKDLQNLDKRIKTIRQHGKHLTVAARNMLAKFIERPNLVARGSVSKKQRDWIDKLYTNNVADQWKETNDNS